MSRNALIGLAVVLLAWALANTWVITKYHRTRELYPMTAWQMFSGRPKEFVRHFEFEIVSHEGSSADTLEGHLLVTGAKSRGTKLRKILESVWRSKTRGCKDYRTRDFRECKKHGVSPWVLPEDIAQMWLDESVQYLNLEGPPHSITLIKVEQPVDFGPDGKRLPRERTAVLEWRPGSGRTVELSP